MKKQYLFLFFVAIFTTHLLFAKDLNSSITVSFMPRTNWLFFSDDYFEYNIEPSFLTTVELGLKYKNLLNLFFSIDYNYKDNYIGEIIDSRTFSKFTGLIGINNFALRATFSQIEGTAEWKGPMIPGQPQIAVINTQYFFIDLMYTFFDSMMAIGLSYLNYQIPVSLGSAYQDSVEYNFYGILYSLSSFRYFMNYFFEERKAGIRIFADTDVYFGYFTTSGLTHEGKRRALIGLKVDTDVINAGLTKYGIGFSHGFTIGICGGIPIKNSLIGFGIGYDGMYFLLDQFHIRHGFIIKTNFSF